MAPPVISRPLTFSQKQNLSLHLSKITKVLAEELIDVIDDEVNKPKRLWVRNWIKRRNKLGASNLLLKELAVEDPAEYRLFLRMSPQVFEELLNRVSPAIQRQDTLLREAIPAKTKLELTLTFLASGSNYRVLSHLFRVPKSSISKLLPEVLDAICENLKEFIQVPSTAHEWEETRKGFMNSWNFPDCYGAIDGKHVLIQAPPNSGSRFFNYKGFYSIVLMAMVNWDYSFTYIDVGCNGCISDGGVFQNSTLYRKLEEGSLFNSAGCIVGDDAFPLKPYLMKPYKLCPLTSEQKIFNYRLSRARRVSENAFGILVSRFRILSRKIECRLQTIDKIVRASCALHNWLGKKSSRYFAQGSLDEEDANGEVVPGRWRSEVNELYNIQDTFGRHRRATKLAIQRRQALTRYFNNEGAVPWQKSKIC